MEISGIGGLSGVAPQVPATQSADGAQGGFGKMLQSVFNGLETAQANADSAVQGLALGDSVDIHDVVLATEMESLAFQFALQVRNRLVETVNTVFNMQV